MRKSRLAAMGLLAGALAGGALAFQPRHEMRFWFDDEAAARAAGATAFVTHPCGAVAVAPVDRMPSYDDAAPLEPELVVEYDESLRELGRWSAPVDAQIWAVRGDALLISQGDRFFWIDPAGNILPTDRPAENRPETVEGQCGIPPGHVESDYAQCRIHRDEADGRPRTLFYEGVCT